MENPTDKQIAQTMKDAGVERNRAIQIFRFAAGNDASDVKFIDNETPPLTGENP